MSHVTDSSYTIAWRTMNYIHSFFAVNKFINSRNVCAMNDEREIKYNALKMSSFSFNTGLKSYPLQSRRVVRGFALNADDHCYFGHWPALTSFVHPSVGHGREFFALFIYLNVENLYKNATILTKELFLQQQDFLQQWRKNDATTSWRHIFQVGAYMQFTQLHISQSYQER